MFDLNNRIWLFGHLLFIKPNKIQITFPKIEISFPLTFSFNIFIALKDF